MKKTMIKVEGMQCHSCEFLLKDSIGELKGVIRAEISCKKGEAIVEFDESKTSINKIKNVIITGGYGVR